MIRYLTAVASATIFFSILQVIIMMLVSRSADGIVDDYLLFGVYLVVLLSLVAALAFPFAAAAQIVASQREVTDYRYWLVAGAIVGIAVAVLCSLTAVGNDTPIVYDGSKSITLVHRLRIGLMSGLAGALGGYVFRRMDRQP